MKKYTLFSVAFLTIFLGILFFAKFSSATILFQDNFDTETITNPMEGAPNGSTEFGGWAWSGGSESDQRTVGGVTHYPSEFVSPGRGGTDKAFANWRNGTSWVANSGERNAYWEVLNFNGIQNGVYRELYIGFSMLISSGMTLDNQEWHKFSWPAQRADGGGSGPGVDFFYGLTNLDFLVSSIVPGNEGGGWTDLFTVPTDGEWHFYLYRMKLNSDTEVRDGILESWIDGVKQTDNSRYDLDYGGSSASYFQGGASRLDVGLGNMGEYAEATWQDSWKALLIDDFVVSTSYVDLDGTTPSPYCGDYSCNNNETCSTCPGDCGTCPITHPELPGWTFCANENEQCSFSGTKEVQYGASSQYFSGIYIDSVLCANSIFGDPILGQVKYCYWRDLGDTTPPAAPTGVRVS